MDVDAIGVRVGAKNGCRCAVGLPKMDAGVRWALQKWAKAPKFGKAVKFANGWIYGVLVPYVLVYLF
jgi:hypothetical protein